jgi:hypothetical protein
MSRYQSLAEVLKVALVPIFAFAFAFAKAILCWTTAWIFWERYEFSATCLGIGCGGIVIALCSYLLVLTNEMRKTDMADEKTARRR